MIKNRLELTSKLKSPPPKIFNGINWAQFQNNTYALPLIPQIRSKDDIDRLIEKITNEIKHAFDRATTKSFYKEFYKFDADVRRLTTNENRTRKTWQRTRRISDKIIMNRAQQNLKNYLYRQI